MALHTYGDGGTSYSGFPSLQPTSGYRWIGYFGQAGGGATVVESNMFEFQQNGVIRLHELNAGRPLQKPNLPIPIKAAPAVPGPSLDRPMSRSTLARLRR